MMAEAELLTTAEVAERLKVDEETVRRWLRKGDIRGINLGRRGGWRVRSEELERFLQDRER